MASSGSSSGSTAKPVASKNLPGVRDWGPPSPYEPFLKPSLSKPPKRRTSWYSWEESALAQVADASTARMMSATRRRPSTRLGEAFIAPFPCPRKCRGWPRAPPAAPDAPDRGAGGRRDHEQRDHRDRGHGRVFGVVGGHAVARTLHGLLVFLFLLRRDGGRGYGRGA